MPRRLTTEEFIEKARKIHGDKYSYERAVYITGRRKVTITCPEHGDFEQEACSHLQGAGCAKCSGNARLTTQDFIEQAREVHGDRYGYDRSVYTSTMKKIVITCPEHGDFRQTPDNHLHGQGCLNCGGTLKLTTSQFIEKARNVHGDRYSYDKTVYTNNSDKIIITCPDHGDFLQRPAGHLKGYGCAKCSGNPRLTTREFIEKAREVHGDRYTYDKVVYVSTHNKVAITCPEHGIFLQTPASHSQGVGCPACATCGFNPDKQAYLYILLDTETHSRVKIGISNVPDQRLVQLKRRTPFSIERIDLFETPPEVTLQIEKFCHSQLDSANLTGFDGVTEWFKFDGGKLESLRAFILTAGGTRV